MLWWHGGWLPRALPPRCSSAAVVGQEASWAAAGMIAPQAEAECPGPFFDFCMKARDAFDGIVDRLVRDGGVDPNTIAPEFSMSLWTRMSAYNSSGAPGGSGV